MAQTNRQKFNELAQVIQTKTGNNNQFSGNQFIEEIRSIDRLIPMSAYANEEITNGYYGYEVCEVARSYLNTRYCEDGHVRWNYNDTSIFDVPKDSTTASIKGLPKQKKANGIDDSVQWEEHLINSRRGLNCIDCSTFVGLVLRGIDYEHSPYNHSIWTWDPSTSWEGGIRKMTEKSSRVWKQSCLDYQPVKSGMDVVYLGYSDGYTVRTAAGLAEFYYKNGKVIYDKKIEGNLTAVKNSSNKVVGFKAADNVDMFRKIYPGDLLFFASASASANQKKRFRSISHVGIASENPRYFYEATTMRETLYYRDLLPTATNATGKYPEIVLILRPDYRPKPTLNYQVPIRKNLLEFPFTFSRVSTEDKIKNYAKKYNVSEAEARTAIVNQIATADSYKGLWVKTLAPNKLGVWGQNTGTVYQSLRGSTDPELGAYNKLTLTPGKYEMHLNHNGAHAPQSTGLALQLKKAGKTNDVLAVGETIVELETSALESAVIDEEGNVVEWFTTAGTTASAVRANKSTGASFTITSDTDVCVRLYYASSSSYYYGNWTSSFDLSQPKEYTEIEFSLIRVE